MASLGKICRSTVRIGSPSSDPEMLGCRTTERATHDNPVLLDGRREISRLGQRLSHWIRLFPNNLHSVERVYSAFFPSPAAHQSVPTKSLVAASQTRETDLQVHILANIWTDFADGGATKQSSSGSLFLDRGRTVRVYLSSVAPVA